MRFPWTRRDALALENPSLELEVGTLINGRLRKNAAYFPASMTFPPPMEMTACVLFGIEVREVYNGKEAVEDVRTTPPGYYDAGNGWTGGNANDQTA